ncbi:MAG: ABC transporter ATP-binding protein [Ruminococcaceae bacterium]|nr:ABC transporter ATP-binding protein [Oscillospiraceae bacterium]
MIAANFFLIPTMVASPYFIQAMIDKVLYAGSINAFFYVVVGLILVYLIRLILDGIILWSSNRIYNRFTHRLRLEVLRKYHRMPNELYETMSIGELKLRFWDDIESMGNFLKAQVADYFFYFLLAIVALILSLCADWRLTLICLPVVPIVFLINYLIGKGLKKINEEIRTIHKEYYAFEHNALQYHREIKAQNVENHFVGRFMKYREILAKIGYRQIRYWFYEEVFTDFKINYLTTTLVFLAGAHLVLEQQMTMGTLVLVSNFFNLLFTGLDGVNTKRIQLKTYSPYYQRVFETLNLPEEQDQNKSTAKLTGGLEVKNLSFMYENKKNFVLKELNFNVAKNGYLAIVGSSGCGKSTLVKLLLGLYTPSNGHILFENETGNFFEINTISKKTLYNQISAVMQDATLFNTTIRDNLSLGNREASEDKVISACKKVGIHDFISGLPLGYDTIVGERGIKLSGGQKQRIIIAQALLKNPKILILDEATSSLDKISEDKINFCLTNNKKEITVILISHKPASIARAKEKITIEEGAIIS